MHHVGIDRSHVPGRIRRVRSSRFPFVWHWGIEGRFLDQNGQPTMWHAQKNDIMRCTDYAYFVQDAFVTEIVWKPESYAQAVWVIERLQSIEGLRWNLVTANCEQMIRWAVEGRAHSDQLAVGVVACLAGVVALAALNS